MPRYTTKDNHVVRSRAEMLIDNLLHELAIPHEYEKKIQVGGVTIRPDWYLPKQNAYIEFWGMERNEKYRENELKKLQLYTEYKITCLSLKDDDLKDYGKMEKRILEFLQRQSANGSPELKATPTSGKMKNVIKHVVTNVKTHQLTKNREKILSGDYCYFCLEPKKRDKRKPLCWMCYDNVQEKKICALCGSSLGFFTFHKDKNPFKVYLCNSCKDNTHTNCKTCGRNIRQPQEGKPLCYQCYSKVSLASPGLRRKKSRW